MSSRRATDTIPRLHQLVPHMSDFLVRMSDGSLTFEEARRGYAETVTRLAAQGLGRQTASRLSDADAYWSPTAELLQEAIRLGFVQRQPLPSARLHLDAHRATEHKLTTRGCEAATLVTSAPSAFRLLLADTAIASHPYLRSFLLLLDESPLICPELREGEIESGRGEGRDTQYWASWAAERINAQADHDVTTPDAVQAEMKQAVTKRFGANPIRRPTNKALAEALNDAFAAASLRGRKVPIGATDLKVLKAWGSQLLLFDQSRYVPAYADGNVIWLASDLVRENDNDLAARPRTFAQHGTAVARALVDAYRRQAHGRMTELVTMPYLPIHEVRAEAAFECGVTRALADIVLERLAAGEFDELGVQVWLHLSGGEVRSSEPIYRRGGTRRFSMTMTTKPEEER